MSAVRLIVGLGNPGPEYRDTRHNAGFILVDHMAVHSGLSWSREKRFSAEVASDRRDGRHRIFVKPQTFMNLSGQSVGAVIRFHRLALSQLLVIVDDADLPLGSLRMRPEGSSGGHHGLESIEAHLGSRQFARLKVGIARPDHGKRDLAGHVLGKFSGEECGVLEMVLHRAAKQVECWATEGVAKAMNGFNGALSLPPTV